MNVHLHRPSLLGLALMILAPIGLELEAQEPPAAAVGPIVLITLDTTRADHLGAWGWPYARTPYLDGLAARGVRFARCDASAPITLPSHATILTGRQPPRHGVRDNAIFTLPDAECTVAEALSEQGWSTAAVVSATVLARHYGLSAGFDHYDDALEGAAVERPADRTTDAALAVLARLAPPYFLWVHYYDPHDPYRAPTRWRAKARGPHADYDGEIAFMDAEIGRLLDALPEAARIVVVGDHGEMLGDGGEATHGLLLGAGARRVPLLLAGPGVPAKRAVDCLVRTADVAPTILALAGLAAHEGLDGVSLLPLAHGAACDEESLAYSETFLPFFSYRWYPLRALSDGEVLYLHGRRPGLYDLRADPTERRDLAAERPADVARWSRHLEAHLAAMGDALDASPGSAQPLSEEERKRLASLGYLSGGASGGPVTGDLPDPRDMVDVAAEILATKDLVDAGRCNEALPRLTAVLERDPNNVPAYNQSGLCLEHVGRLRSALNAYRRAAAINPLSAVPIHNAATVLIRLGEMDEAEEALTDALALDPRSPGVAANLAKLRRSKGDAAGAVAALDAAEAAGSTHPGLALERGMLAAGRGDMAAALAAFELAAERAPGDPNALENAAKAAALLERSERAVTLYRRLLALDATRTDAWFALATVYFQQLGDKPAARQALEHAIAAETDPARRARFEGFLRQLAE